MIPTPQGHISFHDTIPRINDIHNTREILHNQISQNQHQTTFPTPHNANKVYVEKQTQNAQNK